jgi:hypothetical protein
MRQTEGDMKKSGYSELQIVMILKEVEGGRLLQATVAGLPSICLLAPEANPD